MRSEVETLDPSLSHLKSNNSVISIASLYGCIVSWLQYSLWWRQMFVGVEVFFVLLDALSLYLAEQIHGVIDFRDFRPRDFISSSFIFTNEHVPTVTSVQCAYG